MTDGDSLLAAILDDPDDDGLRLIYADWLEENGEAERAEFIRVQCELARVKCSSRCNLRAAGVRSNGCVCLRADICRRERELFEDNGSAWREQESPWAGASYLHRPPHGPGANPSHTIWDRGFIDTITTTFQLACDHLPAIVRRHPVRAHAGMVTDREPFDSAAGWRWVGDHECRWNENENSRVDTRIYWLCRKIYPTREDAMIALAVSLIENAKQTVTLGSVGI